MFNKRKCSCDRQGFGFDGQFGGRQGMMGQGMMNPIVEPTITTCDQKDFYCEVPHVCPIHHHTVNRVHYVHTYTPEYSCSESTEIINNDCGSCCNFVNR